MRQLTVSSFVTLDGVIQAPGGPDEDPTGGFDHGGWSVTYWDDVIESHLGASMGTENDFLLGRRTYEIFAAHWPHADPDEVARRERLAGGTN
jgi:dihydrofolate reductase